MAMLYLSHVLLARMLGAEQYGIYFYVLSWVSIVVIFCKFGLDTALQRFLPEYILNQRWALCKGILKQSTISSFLIGLSFSILSSISLFIFRKYMNEALFYTFLISTIVLPIWTLNKILQGALLAFKKPVYSILPDGIVHPALLILFVWVIQSQTTQDISAFTTMSLHTVLLAITLAIYIALLNRDCLTDEIYNSKPNFENKKWIYFALPMLVISSTQLLMNYADVLIIGFIIDTKNSGIYGAAAKVSSLVTIGLIFVNSILAPYISELFHNGKRGDLQILVTSSTRIATLIAIPTFVTLYFFGKSILGLFGDEFTIGYKSMIILSICGVINVIAGSVGLLMSMTGYQIQSAYIFLSGSIINIILNIILIPRFGIEGAAIATGISMVYWNVFLALFIRFKIKINSTILARQVHAYSDS